MSRVVNQYLAHFHVISFFFICQTQKQPKPQHLTSKSKPTQQRPSRQSEFNNNYHPTPTSSYNKSSSYPNFSSNSTNSNNSSNGQHYVSVNNQNANPQVIIGTSILLELFFFKKIVRLQSNRACSLSAKSFLRILMLSCRFFFVW